MPNYRRLFRPGGTYFFTIVTQDRRPIFTSALARLILRSAIARTRKSRPFGLPAMVLLEDHLHLILALPDGDIDFSTRISAIKARFTHDFLAAGEREGFTSFSRQLRGGRGVWQPRFYEHLIGSETDLNNHLNYVHYNPVKHGLATCPHAYPYSTFSRWVKRGNYEPTWACSCQSPARSPDFAWVQDRKME
jgi:putative transposase